MLTVLPILTRLARWAGLGREGGTLSRAARPPGQAGSAGNGRSHDGEAGGGARAARAGRSSRGSGRHAYQLSLGDSLHCVRRVALALARWYARGSRNPPLRLAGCDKNCDPVVPCTIAVLFSRALPGGKDTWVVRPSQVIDRVEVAPRFQFTSALGTSRSSNPWRTPGALQTQGLEPEALLPTGSPGMCRSGRKAACGGLIGAKLDMKVPRGLRSHPGPGAPYSTNTIEPHK